MTTHRARFPFVYALAAACAAGGLSCGASLNAVYEGDVRFEHCMALDARPGELGETRKTCWDEWVKYYTFGQTRDRVDYARMRRKQLSDEDDGKDAWAPPALAQRVVPEPTNVLAPPPLTLADVKTSEPAASVAPVKEAPEPPAAACQSSCRETWTSCKGGCTGAACDKCTAAYKRCMKKCF